MTPRKETKQKGIKVIKPKIKEIPPLEVEVIRPNLKEKFEINPVECKIEVITTVPLPEGHIRCIVITPFDGMLDKHQIGDIVDLPERRYKSMSFRGLVKEYKGLRQPNKRR